MEASLMWAGINGWTPSPHCGAKGQTRLISSATDGRLRGHRGFAAR